jgi:predicted transcriptional regulator
MKEYPITFLVRLQPKHKNIITRLAKGYKKSEAWVVRDAIELIDRQEREYDKTLKTKWTA